MKKYFVLLLIFFANLMHAKEYFVHPTLGNDAFSGTSKTEAFRTLERLAQIKPEAGDQIYLAGGHVLSGTLTIQNIKGTAAKPITYSSIDWDDTAKSAKAKIDANGNLYGILVQNSSFIKVSNIEIVADGPQQSNQTGAMRVGCLILNEKNETCKSIVLENLHIHHIFYEPQGFTRGKEEVRSANGTQKYGWGIRLISTEDFSAIENVKILNCNIENVSHTGIKLTGKNKNIQQIAIFGNKVHRTGGPGIQMSDVKYVHVHHNEVNRSGSTDDSRKWGRGSGLWTWSASNVLIENNRFLYANGPGDSSGAHIDYNCDHIILQYNFSAHNAGGFCEILGNNYQCAYRFNISVNDGHRVKGQDGAFQEGKVFWISGYQGDKKPKKGPVNSYFYNNTVYADKNMVSKIAIESNSVGLCIMNNIFHIENNAKMVDGDQMQNEKGLNIKIRNTLFKNNVFLSNSSWPADCKIQDEVPLFGNASFANPGGLNIEDYIPSNLKITKSGAEIEAIPEDNYMLMGGLKLHHDILGNDIRNKNFMGAISPDYKPAPGKS